MNKEECKRAEKCNAPLCPLNPESLEHGIWYPDEEICTNKSMSGVDWIVRQKKLAKRAKPGFYFTISMLKHDCRIVKGIEGLDPNLDERPQLKKWFQNHRAITEEERQRLRDRGKEMYKQTRFKRKK